jgi:uncharacterized protein (DUF302 family)
VLRVTDARAVVRELESGGTIMATEATTYGIRRIVDAAYEDVVERAKVALQDEQFGVLCEIDIKEKLREKLGVDFQRYVILGACNPPLAHKALLAEPEIGLLLPCNVIVYETAPGHCVVSAVDPDAMLSVVGDQPAVRAVATDAKARLTRAIEAI